jgi:uncharacterized protein (TIGR02246 family)
MRTQSLRCTRYLAVCRWPTLASAVILSVVCISAADTKTRTDASNSADANKSTAIDKKSPDKRNQDEAQIRAGEHAFVKAFNTGDAKAIAAFWAPNGSLIDEEGTLFRGRAAIEEQYGALFKEHPTARIQIAITSIEFPTTTTAIEDGIARVVAKDNTPPTASRYTAMHVRQDGKWLMASVRESPLELRSSFAQLQDLGWLIGNWEAKGDGNTLRSHFRWIAGKSFIQRDYSVERDGLVTSSGMQIIGWDPEAQQIRSWSFDSSGGYGTGLWSPVGEDMRIDCAGLLADGTRTSSRDLLIRVPGHDNVLGWRSTDRRAGETQLPDIREVVLDRVAEKR